MAQVIPFPTPRAAAFAPAQLPAFATDRDEALFNVRSARAERDSSTPAERRHHIAQIKLRWWERELATIAPSRGG